MYQYAARVNALRQLLVVVLRATVITGVAGNRVAVTPAGAADQASKTLRQGTETRPRASYAPRSRAWHFNTVLDILVSATALGVIANVTVGRVRG